MGSAPPERYAHYAEVLEWVLINRGGAGVAADAPVRRWIETLRRSARGETVLPVPGSGQLATGSGGDAENLAAVCDFHAACVAAHALWTIESRYSSGAIGELLVHGNFIKAELGGRHASKKQDPALPGGIGSLVIAADLARLGGQRLEIAGSKSKAMDVEWRADAAIIRVEAKGRELVGAFGPKATVSTMTEWAVGQIVRAGPAIRARTKDDGVKALQVVRLTAFAPVPLARAVSEIRWAALLRQKLRGTSPYRLPHAIVLHWMGIDIDDEHVVADNLPHHIDVLPAKPRPSQAAIDAFHTMIERPTTSAPGLRPRRPAVPSRAR